MIVMKLVKSLRAISPLIATILLITVTVSGGIVAYAVFTSAANVGSQKTQVNFDYLALYKSIGEPKAIFAATLKNAGNKPIVSLKIQLHNESDYLSPSVTNSTPLNPGMSTSIVLTPPTIHAEWYVVGNFYTVQIVKAVATDGSSYSHVTTVMCLGLTGAVEAGSVYLTVLANPDLGSTTPPRGVHSYSIGQPATVSALPSTGYEFLWWTLDGEEFIDNPITLLMDANHTLSAFFIVPETPLEGNYSTWTNKWTNDLSLTRISMFSVSESANNILVYSGYYGILYTIKLADGTYVEDPSDYPIYAYEQNIFTSIKNKYAVLVRENVSGNNLLDIYKDNVLIQTIDLFAAFGYTSATQVAISPDGKYILVSDYNLGSALFEGA